MSLITVKMGKISTTHRYYNMFYY